MSNGAATLPTHERLMFLRSRLACRRPRRTTLFVVPWINIALLLFGFNLIQSQRVLSPGIVLALPAAPFAGGAPPDAEVLAVLRNGAIFFRDERVAAENLQTVLRRAHQAGAAGSLLVEADGEVRHRLLSDVYNAALAAGFKEVVLATRMPEQGGGHAP